MEPTRTRRADWQTIARGRGFAGGAAFAVAIILILPVAYSARAEARIERIPPDTLFASPFRVAASENEGRLAEAERLAAHYRAWLHDAHRKAYVFGEELSLPVQF